MEVAVGECEPPTGAGLMNSMVVLFPRNVGGVWVFDDDTKGLVREPFVGEVNDILDRLTSEIPDARDGFSLFFSATPFPGHQLKLTWRRGDGYGGNFYYSPELNIEGWLCPAFLKYVEAPPLELYLKAERRR